MSEISAPPINKDGSYCREGLRLFFKEARKKSLKPHQMAAILRVPLHRVIYALGEGQINILGSR